jgi:hypothetical protein
MTERGVTLLCAILNDMLAWQSTSYHIPADVTKAPSLQNPIECNERELRYKCPLGCNVRTFA